MSSFKRFKKSDLVVLPVMANKSWEYNYTTLPEYSSSILVYKGKNLTGSFNSQTDPISEGKYDRLMYDFINHMFYQKYPSHSLDTRSLLSSNYYVSASDQRPTGSYFIYNENPKFINDFPTASNSIIRIIDIDQSVYGNQLNPGSFNISSSNFNIQDDGFGNLWDLPSSLLSPSSSSTIQDLLVNTGSFLLIDNDTVFLISDGVTATHVGNIFYSHGIATITNPDYVFIFPVAPNTINDYYRISNVLANKILTNITANDYIDSGSINYSSFTEYSISGFDFPTNVISGSTITFPTQSDLLEVTPGVYKIGYTLSDNDHGLVSNIATITLELYKSDLVSNISGSLQVCNPSGSNPLSMMVNYGVPPYSYQLYKNNTLVTSSNLTPWYQPTQSLGNLQTGSYLLNVIDREGSIYPFGFNITPKVSFTPLADYSNTFSSSIYVTNVTGGTAPYTYTGSYNISGTPVTVFSTTPTFSFVNFTSSVDWNITARDVNNCYNSSNVSVRGRYFSYANTTCELFPNNIYFTVTGAGTSGTASMAIYVNDVLYANYVESSSFATGSFNVNVGDKVTVSVAQDAKNLASTNLVWAIYDRDGNGVYLGTDDFITHPIWNDGYTFIVNDINQTYLIDIEWN